MTALEEYREAVVALGEAACFSNDKATGNPMLGRFEDPLPGARVRLDAAVRALIAEGINKCVDHADSWTTERIPWLEGEAIAAELLPEET
jgi:hypothetical protein